jgi:tetratricopeptide (TPR) repeat protein
MSLLMDALRRAETSKQEAARALVGGEAGPGHDAKLGRQPRLPQQPDVSIDPLSNSARRQETDDDELTLAPLSIAPHGKPPSASSIEQTVDQTERDAVRNAFAAKLANAPPSRGMLWFVLGMLGIAALAIGAYVWFQVNNLGGNMLAPAGPRSASTATTVPPPTPYVVPAIQVNPTPIFTPASPSTAATSPENFARSTFTPPRSTPQPIPTSSAAPDEASSPAIHLTRTKPEPDANLLRGHDNMQQNKLDLARRDFEQALRRDPNNTDALLALAAIARHQGRAGDAERRNQQALLANPSDPAAQAAVLSGAVAATDPQTTESRLKSLLAGQPESAPLNFALGNLYARQQRWAEAQQVYFNAVAADSDHPDYLFNLAVSLDHIRQSRPAAQHYRLALEAATKRPAVFDEAQVKKRLQELETAMTPGQQR